MKTIKTGVLGYGFSGRIFQCPFIESHDAFELSAVVQRHGRQAKKDYPKITLYDNYKAMLDNDDIELIIIATPAHLHYDHAMKALEAHKHVLIEKPFATTQKEAKALIKKAKSLNKVITVYQNRRFDGDFLTIKKLLNDDIKLYELEATWDRSVLTIDHSDWHEQGHQGSDVLYDLGTHFLDQALHLFGYPESLYGITKSLRPHSKISDFFSMELEYNDKMVRLKSCLHASKEDVRYKLHTNKGTFYFYKMDEQENQLLAGIRPLDENYGDKSTYDFFNLNGEKTTHKKLVGNYLSYFDQLAKAIRENRKLPVSHEDALTVITFLERISTGRN
ncbi:MAG: Gfo/Idh/MocA family oxidoreductase [Candidatus Izemoplasma sp.]|nr:Gfo/Idh/MocA family oxidoreductase [Candidatus Izemoplasma sp.]